jgi:hypothetical protein
MLRVAALCLHHVEILVMLVAIEIAVNTTMFTTISMLLTLRGHLFSLAKALVKQLIPNFAIV